MIAAAPLVPATPAPSYLSVTGAEVVFVLLGVLALAAAVLVVTTRVVVHAALWLVVTLGALAGCYLVLTAEFVAWVQVLIYVGAVVVLLLFGVMLTRATVGGSERVETDRGSRIAALVLGAAAAATLVTLVADAFRTAYIDLDNAAGSGAESTGSALFRTFVLPFEVVSVLLLAALVGAVVLSRRDIGPGPDGP